MLISFAPFWFLEDDTIVIFDSLVFFILNFLRAFSRKKIIIILFLNFPSNWQLCKLMGENWWHWQEWWRCQTNPHTHWWILFGVSPPFIDENLIPCKHNHLLWLNLLILRANKIRNWKKSVSRLLLNLYYAHKLLGGLRDDLR